MDWKKILWGIAVFAGLAAVVSGVIGIDARAADANPVASIGLALASFSLLKARESMS